MDRSYILFDEVLSSKQDRSNGTRQTLAEAEANRVYVANHARHGNAQVFSRVEDARSIHVNLGRVPLADLGQIFEPLQRQNLAAAHVVGVFNKHKVGDGFVNVEPAEHIGELLQTERTVGFVLDGMQQDSGQLGGSSLLVQENVRSITDDSFRPPATTMDHN